MSTISFRKTSNPELIEALNAIRADRSIDEGTFKSVTANGMTATLDNPLVVSTTRLDNAAVKLQDDGTVLLMARVETGYTYKGKGKSVKILMTLHEWMLTASMKEYVKRSAMHTGKSFYVGQSGFDYTGSGFIWDVITLTNPLDVLVYGAVEVEIDAEMHNTLLAEPYFSDADLDASQSAFIDAEEQKLPTRSRAIAADGSRRRPTLRTEKVAPAPAAELVAKDETELTADELEALEDDVYGATAAVTVAHSRPVRKANDDGGV